MSSFIGNRITDRFRSTSKEVAALSEGLSRADEKLDLVDDGLQFLFSKLMGVRVEDAGLIQEDFDKLRDQLAEAMITHATVRDKLMGLFSKFEALIGHGYETSELYIEARTLITRTLADLVKFRGDYATTATMMMSLLDDEVFQQLIASDDAASTRMLDLIGEERVIAWLGGLLQKRADASSIESYIRALEAEVRGNS